MFELKSSAFGEGERIPAKYTCEGEDVSPPLSWSGAPDGTRSFALLCDDPDAPMGTWRHWAAYDIPAEQSGLQEALPTDAAVGDLRQGTNDFRKTGYGGPCPPPGHGVHHYHFKLLALGVETLELPAGAPFDEIERGARGHVLAEAELVGTYDR